MAITPTAQPTKIELKLCTINDINYFSINSVGEPIPNFHVKELRIYEDICKFYFTGQLVIETEQNSHEFLLGPTVPVTISFEATRTDGAPSLYYKKDFKIYSYESKPLSGGADARMEHTIQLISQEYYNDRHNTVMQGFPNVTGTEAAAQIHNKYIQREGSLRIPVPSTGPIGSKDVPHQSRNVKPVKAIHDILDRCVFARYPSCAPTYFKDVNGYVIAPLQYLLEVPAPSAAFLHQPTAGEDLGMVLHGYHLVQHLRPMAPPGEASSDSASMVMGMLSAAQFFDIKTGTTQNNKASRDQIMKLPFINKIPNMKARVTQMLAEANRGGFGSRNMFHIVDELMQSMSIQKHGPGGYNKAQEAFLTALTYSQKYWVSVPSQSGLLVTCGSRILVRYPIAVVPEIQMVEKIMFVPRLIHEIRFTQGNKREPVMIQGITDIYGVIW